MQLPPLAVMATWPKPNYVDPVTRGHGVVIVNAICMSLAFIVTLLRLYTRIWITATPGVDDILIVIALLFAIAMVIVTSIATENWGFNRHIWDLPVTWIPTVEKLNLVFQITFSWASSLTKISLMWFCRRLLGRSKGNFAVYNWAFIGAMILVILSVISFTIASIFQCTPVKAYWEVNPQYPHKCLNDPAIVFAASVVNIVTDFISTTLPMPLIWRLKLPTRQRIAVISIFALGVIVNVAGSVRTVYVWKSMVAGIDTTWIGWPILVAAGMEISLGLICSSAPALRPLVTAFLPHLLQSSLNLSKYAHRSQRSRGQKLWSSASRSRNSHAVPRDFAPPNDCESDRFEIMRTVEMESWTESRLAHHAETGLDYGYGVDNRAVSPISAGEKQEPFVFTNAASSESSRSLPRDI